MYVYGRNTVRELLLTAKNVKNVYITQNNKELISLCNEKNITYVLTENKKLDSMVEGNHQGVVVEVEDYKYYDLEKLVPENISSSLIIMLDSLEDPHNLGAILRIADAAGVDGIIIPKNRCVKLNNTVAKVSTGAIEHIKVCEVVNLNTTLEKLKKIGYWIIGAEIDEKSVDYTKMDYKMPICLIIGGEGKGISRLVKQNCDFLIKIPMHGHVNSLNASVSCGIVVYEILRNRNSK